jgi:hypothetical protein
MDDQKRSQNEKAHWNSYQRAFCLATERARILIRMDTISNPAQETYHASNAAHLAATLRNFAPIR